MSKLSFEKDYQESFFARKGFYIALAICLLAVGAATWSAIRSITGSGKSNTLDNSLPQVSSYQGFIAESTDFAGKVVSNEPVSSRLQTPSVPPASSNPVQIFPSSVPKPDEINFVLPVQGDISKDFSVDRLQYSVTYKDLRLHTGIDIIAKTGTKICSAANGIVLKTYDDRLMGYTVEIDHGNGLVAYYSGLSKDVTVSAGDEVNGGQQIGILGKIPSEIDEEPHLHLAMKQGEAWVSPLIVMKLSD